eukprot:TRINITY_DN25852_c0_g1_i1.p2 TRINITY_DN25852_c0_g1~~TRINITY_DN25852_c0_g1_i1.p2  ORF type:complete len:120 (+),score=8.23 TRINITY_DN25852_c0_g1_i1:60-419(+)
MARALIRARVLFSQVRPERLATTSGAGQRLYSRLVASPLPLSSGSGRSLSGGPSAPHYDLPSAPGSSQLAQGRKGPAPVTLEDADWRTKLSSNQYLVLRLLDEREGQCVRRARCRWNAR